MNGSNSATTVALSLEKSIVRTLKDCGAVWHEKVSSNPGYLFGKLEDVYDWYRCLPGKCEKWNRYELVVLDKMFPDLMYALSVLHVIQTSPFGGTPFDTRYHGRLKQEAFEMFNMVFYLLWNAWTEIDTA